MFLKRSYTDCIREGLRDAVEHPRKSVEEQLDEHTESV